MIAYCVKTQAGEIVTIRILTGGNGALQVLEAALGIGRNHSQSAIDSPAAQK